MEGWRDVEEMRNALARGHPCRISGGSSFSARAHTWNISAPFRRGLVLSKVQAILPPLG